MSKRLHLVVASLTILVTTSLVLGDGCWNIQTGPMCDGGHWQEGTLYCEIDGIPCPFTHPWKVFDAAQTIVCIGGQSVGEIRCRANADMVQGTLTTYACVEDFCDVYVVSSVKHGDECPSAELEGGACYR